MMEPIDVSIVSIQSQSNPAIEKIFCQEVTKNDELGKKSCKTEKKLLYKASSNPHGSK